jgi:hypothetical protein
MKKVFRSKVSKLFLFAVGFFTLIAVMLCYAYTKQRVPILMLSGVLFLIIDAVYLLPNIFFTSYVFEEQYLVIREWPFRFTKVFYEDVVSFDDADKNDRIKKAGMSFHVITIGYYDDNDEKKFVQVSPKDMEMFLLVLGSRVNNFKNAEKERADRIQRAKDEKHRRRQKYLDGLEEQKRIDESNVRIIKVSGIKREEGFRVVEED